MDDEYKEAFRVSWADVDMNGHMANSAYLDYATETRFRCLASRGFGPDQFQRHRVGPAILEDRVRYLRELLYLERFEVSFAYESLDQKGSEFKVTNRFYRNGEMVAEVTARGVWFDLDKRKTVVPPAELAAILPSQTTP